MTALAFVCCLAIVIASRGGEPGYRLRSIAEIESTRILPSWRSFLAVRGVFCVDHAGTLTTAQANIHPDASQVAVRRSFRSLRTSLSAIDSGHPLPRSSFVLYERDAVRGRHGIQQSGGDSAATGSRVPVDRW